MGLRRLSVSALSVKSGSSAISSPHKQSNRSSIALPGQLGDRSPNPPQLHNQSEESSVVSNSNINVDLDAKRQSNYENTVHDLNGNENVDAQNKNEDDEDVEFTELPPDSVYTPRLFVSSHIPLRLSSPLPKGNNSLVVPTVIPSRSSSAISKRHNDNDDLVIYRLNQRNEKKELRFECKTVNI